MCSHVHTWEKFKLYHLCSFTIFWVTSLKHILTRKMSAHKININLVKFDGVFVGAAVVIHGFSYADWGCPTGKIANGKVCIGRASHHYVFVNVLSEYSNLKMPFDTVDTWKKVDNCVSWVVKFLPTVLKSTPKCHLIEREIIGLVLFLDSQLCIYNCFVRVIQSENAFRHLEKSR